MSKINIPETVLPGFSSIASFSKEAMNKLVEYLQSIPIKANFEEFGKFLSADLDVKAPKEVVKTILSFSELLSEPNADYNLLAKDLSESYKEISKENDEVEERLKSNLLEIFENSKRLKLSLKANRLIKENDNSFKDAKIVTDIRLVFDEELDNKKRNAFVVHRLHVRFRKANEINDVYLSLDMEELKDLKSEIERAIKKEEIIKKDYNDTIGFI